MRLSWFAPLAVAAALSSLDAHAEETFRPGVADGLVLSMPSVARSYGEVQPAGPGTALALPVVSTLEAGPAYRGATTMDLAPPKRLDATALHASHPSLAWVGAGMGASGMAVGGTFLGLSAVNASAAGNSMRQTLASSDRTIGVAGLLGGGVMLGLGIVALVSSGTDVRTALAETFSRMPASGKPALKLAF